MSVCACVCVHVCVCVCGGGGGGGMRDKLHNNFAHFLQKLYYFIPFRIAFQNRNVQKAFETHLNDSHNELVSPKRTRRSDPSPKILLGELKCLFCMKVN